MQEVLPAHVDMNAHTAIPAAVAVQPAISPEQH